MTLARLHSCELRKVSYSATYGGNQFFQAFSPGKP